jgi:quercetin dioxygenase-like cupin family protein
MKQSETYKRFDSGKIVFPEKEIDASLVSWKKHPVFSGVFVKELVSAADTDGTFNCLLIKIEKGAEVSDHTHDTQWEFNEVLDGDGVFGFGDKKSACKPGDSYVNPPGISHSVAALKEDLYIFAKFIPAMR